MSYQAIWELHGLPNSMHGKSFLDVGCWEGEMCAEAVRRGARSVLGVDLCTSPELTANVAAAGFKFIQLDIFSEKALELPEFDVVYCAGVFYHVENPFSLLFRLRKLMSPNAELYLETTYVCDDNQLPQLTFHPASTLDNNPSNWWSPNERCLLEMLRASSFSEIAVTSRSSKTVATTDDCVSSIGRISTRALNSGADPSDKVLPRAPRLMPTAPNEGSRR